MAFVVDQDDGFTTVDLGDSETATSSALETECQPCRRDGEQANAIGFCVDCDELVCQTCWNMHRKIKTLQTHSLVDITANGEEEEEDNGNEKTPKANKVPKKLCTTHTGDNQLLENYCVRCCELVCSRCVRESHNECETVYIPDLSRFVSKTDGFDDEDLGKLCKGLDATENGLKEVQKKLLANISEIERKHSDVAKEFKEFLDDVHSFVEAMLVSIADPVTDMIEEELKHSEETKDAAQRAYREYMRLSVELGKLENSSWDRKDSTLFRILEDINGIQNIITDRPNSGRTGGHKAALDELYKIQNFLKTIREFASETDLIPIPESQVASFSTQTENDRKPCKITGCLMTSTGLIVADRGNEKIKVFDAVDGRLEAEMSFQFCKI